MGKRWMGVAVSGTKAVLVTAIEESGRPLEIVADDTVDDVPNQVGHDIFEGCKAVFD